MGQMENLLLDVARQAERAAGAVEAALRRVEGVADELGDVRERLRALEAVAAERKEKWDGVERRVDNRLETGDHTFEAIRAEMKILEKNIDTAIRTAASASNVADEAIDEAEEVRKLVAKHAGRASSRLWKAFLVALPYICTGIGTLFAILYNAKGGKP